VTPREWVGSSKLVGRVVRLEPLGPEHYDDLHAITPRDTFQYFLSWPQDWSRAGFGSHMDRVIAEPSRLHYAVIEQASNRAVGSTSFCDIRPPHRGVEIGFTWYAPSHRGTRVNPECKLLMMTHAFETLGCIRLQIKCDALNAHSRAAILKLGASFEGVLRQHMIKQDGVVRDTAMYSILQSEWAGVKAGLLARAS